MQRQRSAVGQTAVATGHRKRAEYVDRAVAHSAGRRRCAATDRQRTGTGDGRATRIVVATAGERYISRRG